MRAAAATRIAVLVSLSTIVPSVASGQPQGTSPAPRHVFEYWFGPTMVFSGLDGTMATDYAVSLQAGDGSGRATQQSNLRTPRHLGVEGGLGIYPSRLFGFQVRVNYVSEGFSGTSGPYQVTLDYVAASPPDHVPAQHQFYSSTNWKPPTGSSAELTVSIDAAARWNAGTRLSGTIGGGFAYFRAKGHADSLAFGQFLLLGDTAVHQSTYAMSVSYGTATALGFDLGGAIAVNLAGPVDFLADLRYFHAGPMSPAVRVTGFANASADPGGLSVEAVNESMSPIKVTLDPSFARVLVGVRIRS